MGYAFARGERGFRSLSVRTQLSVPALKGLSHMSCRRRRGSSYGAERQSKSGRHSQLILGVVLISVSRTRNMGRDLTYRKAKRAVPPDLEPVTPRPAVDSRSSLGRLWGNYHYS